MLLEKIESLITEIEGLHANTAEEIEGSAFEVSVEEGRGECPDAGF